MRATLARKDLYTIQRVEDGVRRNDRYTRDLWCVHGGFAAFGTHIFRRDDYIGAMLIGTFVMMVVYGITTLQVRTLSVGLFQTSEAIPAYRVRL